MSGELRVALSIVQMSEIGVEGDTGADVVDDVREG